jgi:hypothetical protein
MKRIQRIAASRFGTLAILALPGLMTDLRAQVPKEDAIHVCVDAKGVLRLVEPVEPCPAGQKRLQLAEAEPKFEEVEEPEEKRPEPQPESQPDNSRIRDLERRVHELEKARPDRVTAPFEVVDEADKTILKVEPKSVRFYESGKQVADIQAFDDGALFTVSSGDALKASFGVTSGIGGFFMDEGGKSRLELGKGDKGNFRLVFLSPGEMQVAGIGESTEGTGAARIGSSDGKLKASIQVDEDGNGAFQVFNSAGVMIATLTEGSNGGGLLEIASSGGEPMVQAGVHVDGYGVVRTGPASFMTGAGLGLPGSFIFGKK